MADHLLALKVMRVSRPSLAAHPLPFFSDSTTLAAHSRASPLSLESQPLQGVPSTLRDLGQSQILTLPEAFGSISLGETFSSALCINNESSHTILGSHLLVEMQTASNKTTLGQIGGIDSRLDPGQMFTLVVSHEMKELGQHVLVCTVGYHVPPALRNTSIPPEDPTNPTLRTIKKFYKFIVSNPLSVRTKVHIPRSPSALLNRTERNKVFLEVHVQNLNAKPLYFEKIQFECAEGWVLADSTPKNLRDSESKANESSLRSQDTRQYLYILTPTPAATPSFPIAYPPGTIIALGRLDMSWRSSFGEPGRLLTSMLSRKIPLPPAPQPAPAIPPHLQQQRQQPGRPGSPVPYKTRPPSISRPMSPGPGGSISGSLAGTMTPTPGTTVGNLPGTIGSGAAKDVQVDLVVTSIPSTIYLDRPFKVKCSIGALAPLPSPPPNQLIDTSEETEKPSRKIQLTIQHTYHSSIRPTAPPTAAQTMAPEVSSPRALLSALSSPGAGTPRGGVSVPAPDLGTLLQSDLGQPQSLPPPYSDKAPLESPVFLGPSSRVLSPIIISEPAPVPTEGPLVQFGKKDREGKGEGWADVELEFVAVRGSGIVRIGGIRVVGENGAVLGEWDVLGEVWVERSGGGLN
ncbi:DUF974 family protein [Rhizoctonia solani AG-3 Rhs1AP]|uniref:DUF974 family protein n=1 Tax=Rhizoctonia solani AG-3 Rhs1AP TaxID=1086054 RepID=X8J3P9_9AGAM|nr:DUF974 family protein [Rhizoctonia solani AG-3 Rhs1AP]